MKAWPLMCCCPWRHAHLFNLPKHDIEWKTLKQCFSWAPLKPEKKRRPFFKEVYESLLVYMNNGMEHTVYRFIINTLSRRKTCSSKACLYGQIRIHFRCYAWHGKVFGWLEFGLARLYSPLSLDFIATFICKAKRLNCSVTILFPTDPSSYLDGWFILRIRSSISDQ